MNSNLAIEIRNKALELGYENCGIISTTEVLDYGEKLKERINKFPEIKSHSEGFYKFANLHNEYPWAKSIVICSRNYGKYKIPENLKDLIGKYYLVDSRKDTSNKDYKDSISFETYLKNRGLTTETDRSFGITALRWAAIKANIGIIRKNNFFYTENGSYEHLEAWLINEELTLKNEAIFKKCPKNCNICINSCPTNSLCEPFTMNRDTCISCLTTWEGWDLPNETYNKSIGRWIYGCDICQDVCPFNSNAWSEDIEFPGLLELGKMISLGKIIEMDYETLYEYIQPKFWYISKENVWRWKTNALNAMLNTYCSDYDKYIDMACNDVNENVRRTANWVKNSIY